MEQQKLEKQFKQGLKRGRDNQDKKVMEWFALDYPNMNSFYDNIILPSYKEGFNIGMVEGEEKIDDTKHFLAWVSWDVIKDL